MGGDFDGEGLSEPADSPFGGGVVREEGEGAVGYDARGDSTPYHYRMTHLQANAASPRGSNQFPFGALLNHLLRGDLIAIKHPK